MKRLALSLLLLAVVVVWGWTFVAMKEAVAVCGVASFLAVRYAIACAAVAPFALRRANWRSLGVGAGIGLALAGGYLFQTFGLRSTTSSISGIITGLTVVFVPIANRLLFGVRTEAVVWAAVGVAVLGLGLLSGAAPEGFSIGDALTLGCAACFGLHVALLGRYGKGHGTGVLALGQLGAATLVFLAAWPLTEPLVWPPRSVWPAILVTAILATAVAFYVQTYVQQRLPAIQVAMILLMEPLFAAFFGHILAGDRLTPIQALGAVLMVGAMFATELRPAARSAVDSRGPN
jgi:drug/metabolite transporter (DMT)-like permease